MDFRFLVDVNLPKFFGFFNTPNFEFVADLSLTMSDSEIWEYAIAQNLIIITKDTDFYLRCLTTENSPKVVQIALGNVSLKQLHQYFNQNWANILLHLPEARVLIAYSNRLEIVL
jgi:predicted nuclease of predicted toxin-antitoxin system